MTLEKVIERAATAARNAVAGSLASRTRTHNQAADAAEKAVRAALSKENLFVLDFTNNTKEH